MSESFATEVKIDWTELQSEQSQYKENESKKKKKGCIISIKDTEGFLLWHERISLWTLFLWCHFLSVAELGYNSLLSKFSVTSMLCHFYFDLTSFVSLASFAPLYVFHSRSLESGYPLDLRCLCL